MQERFRISKGRPGKPGKLLQKSGSGFIQEELEETQLISKIRCHTGDISGDWRYTLGVGWKF